MLHPLLRARSGVYLITPDWTDTGRLLATLEGLLSAGVALLQYRNKCADIALQREQLTALRSLCQRTATPLIVNDSLALALECGADGVHVGRDDGELAEARRRLPGGIVGASCYDEGARALAAECAGADYVAFGAMFPSRTKPGAVAASPALLGEARARGRARVVAIGGITAERAPGLIAAGADFLAVISDIFEAPDPVARLHLYQRAFARHHQRTD